jgi:predicted transcriptional regulator
VGRKPSTGLTDAEHRIMNVLWDLSEATVGEVVERIEGPSRPAYNTVLTLLRILERKGYVRHEKQARAFTYAPILNRVEACRGALTHLLSRFFNGSREQLVMDLLGHDDVDADQLAQVKTLLNDATFPPGSRPSMSSVTRPSPTAPSDHLSSRAIPLLVRIPDVESRGGSGPEADGIDWAALGRASAAAGIAVAKAGAATGLAASRASSSVSRFFKNGGIAIARSLSYTASGFSRTARL